MHWPALADFPLHKIVWTLAIVSVALLARIGLRKTNRHHESAASRRAIWARKAVALAIGGTAVVMLLGVWLGDPHRLAVFGGLIGAGIAFASQNAMLSIAGFFVIVFGKVFNLGDRIEFGGVRGDVLDIGLFKTTIMEMGVPGALHPDPNHWISARQYTGRVVTVVNAEVFQKPVFNYTAALDLIWEEIKVPLKYGTDVNLVEGLILAAARDVTAQYVTAGRTQMEELREKYLVHASDLAPRVFVGFTDNWIELTLRFTASAHEVRDVKDKLSRRLLAEFTDRGIQVASTTVELVGAPRIDVDAHTH